MELDIELITGPLADRAIGFLSKLPDKYEACITKDETNTSIVKVMIRYKDDNPVLVTATVGDCIIEFLSGMVELNDLIHQSGGILRLGIYYDLTETAVFPVHLSSTCIANLGSFGISLDSTGYPCSEGANWKPSK